MVGRILAATIAVVVAIVFCEAALRIAGPPWLRASMAETAAGHRVLGETPNLFECAKYANGEFIRFQPSVTFSVVNPEYRNEVHITPWGTRATGADGTGKDAIVFAGDSFTFGLGVDDRETFVSRICREQSLTCLNSGFPGSSLSSQLNALEANLEEWGQPTRVVFVFFAGNDLPEIVSLAERAEQRPVQPPARTLSLLRGLNQTVNDSPLLSRSYTLRLFKATARTWAAPNSMDLMFSTAAGASGDFGRRARTALIAALDRLDQLSKARGFSASFIVLPDRYQVFRPLMIDKAHYYHLDPVALDMQFPQRVLEAELDRRGILYQDVLPCLDPRDEEQYYRNDNHLTARGHAVVGSCLVKNGLLQRAAVR